MLADTEQPIVIIHPAAIDAADLDRMPGRVVQRLENFQSSAAAIDLLFRSALETEGPAAFFEFLEFARRLSNLSIYNAMLVKVQRPGAVAVATEKKWKSMHGWIRPRAIPIVILRPFGPVSFVYEYSDVLGVDLPGGDASTLFATGELSPDVYHRMVVAALKHRVKVTETASYGGLLAGTAAALGNLPGILNVSEDDPLWNVEINEHHSLPTRFATLAHELGHIYCGHLGADPAGRWPDRRRKVMSHAQREMEAEAVCWLVCNRNGVTARSAQYLHSLMSESDIQQVSMYAMLAAANLAEAR